MPHTTTEYSIKTLLDMAEEKRLIVPDFQRPFKWKAANVKKLCESLFLQIPFGTSLLLKANTVAFNYRLIDELDMSSVLDDTTEDGDDSENDEEDDEIPENNPHNEEVIGENQRQELFYILDGQQRITSLHKIFRKDLMPDDNEIDGSLGGLRFFLNLELFNYPLARNLGTNSDIIVAKKWNEVLKQLRQLHPNLERPSSEQFFEYCIEQGLYPITRAILTQGINLTNVFLNKMAIKLAMQSIITPDELIQKLPEFQDQVTRWFDKNVQPMFSYISDYRFSALVLENVSLETLTAIFETINTTGMKLSLYDLLVSKLGTFQEANKNTTLPKLITKYVDESHLRSFDEMPRLGGLLSQQSPKVFVLETKRRSPENLHTISLKQSDILKDEYREYFRSIAPDVARGLNKSIDFHFTSLYVFMEKYLPVKDTIAILASLKQIPGISIEKLTAIYWYIVFFVRFDQSTNRILEKIYEDSLPALISNDFKVFSEKLDEFPEFQQFLTSSNKTSFAKALLTYVHSNSTYDWYGCELNNASLEFEDHHIFPSAWLRSNCLRNDVSENRRKLLFNSVLNKLRVSKKANRTALAQAPYQYLVSNDSFSTQSYRRLLLPDSFRNANESPTNSDEFEALLNERYVLVKTHVQNYLRTAFT